MNFTAKVIEKGNVIQRIETHSHRRFTNQINMINWQNKPSVYLRISYKTAKNNFGKFSTFYNDGTYLSKNDFLIAFYSFIEK